MYGWSQEPPRFRVSLAQYVKDTRAFVLSPRDDSHHGTHIAVWVECGPRYECQWIRRFQVEEPTIVALTRSMAEREVSGSYACLALDTLFFTRVTATDDGLTWLSLVDSEIAFDGFAHVVRSWPDMMIFHPPHKIMRAAVAAAAGDNRRGYDFFLEQSVELRETMHTDDVLTGVKLT